MVTNTEAEDGVERGTPEHESGEDNRLLVLNPATGELVALNDLDQLMEEAGIELATTPVDEIVGEKVIIYSHIKNVPSGYGQEGDTFDLWQFARMGTPDVTRLLATSGVLSEQLSNLTKYFPMAVTVYAQTSGKFRYFTLAKPRERKG